MGHQASEHIRVVTAGLNPMGLFLKIFRRSMIGQLLAHRTADYRSRSKALFTVTEYPYFFLSFGFGVMAGASSNKCLFECFEGCARINLPGMTALIRLCLPSSIVWFLCYAFSYTHKEQRLKTRLSMIRRVCTCGMYVMVFEIKMKKLQA